jgi:hypothetical protein
MGIFSSKPRYEPTTWPTVSLTGSSHFVRCEIGGAARRALLMASAVRVVAEHPATRPDRAGQPLLGPSGLASIAETLRPTFAVEGSLVPWIALRGALLFLNMSFSNRDTVMTDVMGIDPSGRALLSPGDADSATQAYLSLSSSMLSMLSAYDELENMSMDSVLADRRFSSVDKESGLQIIAWTATAMIRAGRADVVDNFGEPGRIDFAGWYTEPMFSKAERYHDGSDWTARCRVIERGREEFFTIRLA